MFGLLTGGISGKIIIGLVLLIVVGIGLGYWYFSWSQDQIQILSANSAKLELSVQTQTKTIKAMKKQQERSAKAMKELNAKFSEADDENKKLVKLLAKHRENMNDIIDKRATLYERKVNRATRKVLENFEVITNPEAYYAKPIDNNTE